MFKRTFVGLIKFYRNYLKILMLPTCRFYPSCSCYMQQAIENYGVVKGIQKGAFRILRCNPLSKGGFDPLV